MDTTNGARTVTIASIAIQCLISRCREVSLATDVTQRGILTDLESALGIFGRSQVALKQELLRQANQKKGGEKANYEKAINQW